MTNAKDFPLQIAFRNVAPSPAIEAKVRAAARKLARFHSRITSCGVVVAAPEKRHRRERLFVVRINLAVPGAPSGSTAAVIWTGRTPTSMSPFAMPSMPPSAGWRISCGATKTR